MNILPTVSIYAPDLAGLLLPPIITMLTTNVKDENHRFIISMGVCFLVAFIIKYNELAGGNLAALVTSFGIIFTESQVIFKLYFKNSFLRQVMVDRLTVFEEPVG